MSHGFNRNTSAVHELNVAVREGCKALIGVVGATFGYVCLEKGAAKGRVRGNYIYLVYVAKRTEKDIYLYSS